MDFDPVLLARLQFAFTISFHIIFPSFTIGLSAYIATLHVTAWLTGRDHFLRNMVDLIVALIPDRHERFCIQSSKPLTILVNDGRNLLLIVFLCWHSSSSCFCGC